jgi:hypothetical protein
MPVVVLTVLGAVVAVLGLFAAGSLLMVSVGLAAIVLAGVLHVAERRNQ